MLIRQCLYFSIDWEQAKTKNAYENFVEISITATGNLYGIWDFRGKLCFNGKFKYFISMGTADLPKNIYIYIHLLKIFINV